MENPTTFLWGVTIVMAITSLVLLAGKGSNLIAGYNMANAKNKAKYDELKLCRTMGGGLFIITITMAISLWFNFEFPFLFIEYIVIGVILITIAGMLILTNTICRKK